MLLQEYHRNNSIEQIEFSFSTFKSNSLCQSPIKLPRKKIPFGFYGNLLFIGVLQIVFEAAVGASYDADIAIDDIVVTPGVCPSK